MPEHDEVEMEVFRSGDYGAKGAYTLATLQQMAEDYRPDLLEAPLTFDHAQAGPAYGWVARLRSEGDRLVAVLKGVPQAVKELVRSGAYKRRSVELMRKLPQTGRPYLRAVSLLGAATPEVKGLRDICFAAAPSGDCIAMAGDAGEAQGQAASAPPNPTAPAPATSAPDEVRTLRSQVLQGRVALMFSELRADGYCLPEEDAAGIRHIFATQSGDVARFSDDDADAAVAWVGDFLRRHLVRVPLGEAAAPAAGVHATSPPITTFSDRVAPASFQLHQRVLSLQAAAPGLSYSDALRQAACLLQGAPRT